MAFSSRESASLPRAKDYAAIDALADTIRSRNTQPAKPSEVTMAESATSQKYMCTVCRYVYDPAKGDPDGGIPPGTPFDKIPDNWVCPICRASKKMFKAVQ